MEIVTRVLNFVLGLTAVMLILLGATDKNPVHKSQMLAVGIGLFILTFLIHVIHQMIDKANV